MQRDEQTITDYIGRNLKTPNWYNSMVAHHVIMATTLQEAVVTELTDIRLSGNPYKSLKLSCTLRAKTVKSNHEAVKQFNLFFDGKKFTGKIF